MMRETLVANLHDCLKLVYECTIRTTMIGGVEPCLMGIYQHIPIFFYSLCMSSTAWILALGVVDS